MSEEDILRQRVEAAGAALKRIRRGEAPTPEDLAAAPKLDWWYLTDYHGHPALAGVVTGHPTLRDGDHIRTSLLLWVADDFRAARTLSRFYRLGRPFGDDLATKH